MKNLDDYLERIQRKESIFPIDSFPSNKKEDDEDEEKDIIRTVYPEQDTYKKRIMIDFDGVINSYDHGWNDGKIIDPLIPNAKESILELHNRGYEIVIFTTRASKTENKNNPDIMQNLISYLKQNDIYYDFITSEKLGAICYIDDKAIKFTKEKGWNEVLREIELIDQLSEIKNNE